MRKKHSYIKLRKGDNPDLFTMQYFVQAKNLVSTNLSPVLSRVLKFALKCTNTIKANGKCQCIFKKFCKENEIEKC